MIIFIHVLNELDRRSIEVEVPQTSIEDAVKEIVKNNGIFIQWNNNTCWIPYHTMVEIRTI